MDHFMLLWHGILHETAYDVTCVMQYKNDAK